MNTWMLILLIAVLTYATRYSGFLIGGMTTAAGDGTPRRLPPAADRFLDAVPLAAFAALVVPGIADGPGTLLARLLAAAACAALMTRVSQLWMGLGVGMLVFWLLTWLL